MEVGEVPFGTPQSICNCFHLDWHPVPVLYKANWLHGHHHLRNPWMMICCCSWHWILVLSSIELMLLWSMVFVYFYRWNRGTTPKNDCAKLGVVPTKNRGFALHCLYHAENSKNQSHHRSFNALLSNVKSKGIFSLQNIKTAAQNCQWGVYHPPKCLSPHGTIEICII